MQVIVFGKIVNYETTGNNKPVIVLLHGWADTMHTFKKLEPFLKESYNCIALDLPGFGSSEKPTKAYNLQDYTLFVAEFLRKIDEPNVYAFIGHSNGGSILIKGLSESILKSTKLILLASAGIRSTATFKKSILKYLAKFISVFLFILPSSLKNKIKKFLYAKIGSELYVAEGMQESFKQVVAEDLLEKSSLIKIPTLLIFGGKDTATPVDYGRMYNKSMSNSRLKTIESAGHFLHQTHTGKVIEYAKDFL